MLGAAIFGLASLTDWLDGYLARRRKQVTALGQLMDPLADKLLITAALVSLVQMDLAPAWIVAVMLGREFAVTVLRSLAHSRGVAIPASPLGKFKMASQVVAILLLILASEEMPLFLTLGKTCVVGRGVHGSRLSRRLLPPLQSCPARPRTRGRQRVSGESRRDRRHTPRQLTARSARSTSPARTTYHGRRSDVETGPVPSGSVCRKIVSG